MDVTRRRFFELASSLGLVGPGACKPSIEPTTEPGSEAVPIRSPPTPESPAPITADEVFAHGVAAGDPRSDGMVLWTRVTVPPGTGMVSVG